LAAVGTAAMLWVGGGIIVHGLEGYGLAEPGHSIHLAAKAAAAAVPVMPAVFEWAVGALGSGLVGLVLGALIVALLHLRKH
jgi:hypothetical protein